MFNKQMNYDIVRRILSYSKCPRDLIRFSHVCQLWREVIDNILSKTLLHSQTTGIFDIFPGLHKYHWFSETCKHFNDTKIIKTDDVVANNLPIQHLGNGIFYWRYGSCCYDKVIFQTPIYRSSWDQENFHKIVEHTIIVNDKDLFSFYKKMEKEAGIVHISSSYSGEPNYKLRLISNPNTQFFDQNNKIINLGNINKYCRPFDARYLISLSINSGYKIMFHIIQMQVMDDFPILPTLDRFSFI